MAERKKPVYVALIGDVVASREVADRAALQRRARTELTQINRRFKGVITSAFVLTIGDEFQGLLRGIDGLDRLLGHLRAALDPVEIRIGIGLGRLDTPLLPRAIGMDGPCFHSGRAALRRAAEIGSPVEVEAGIPLPALRIYGTLFGALRRSWTHRQRLVFDLATSGLSGKDIAERLSVRPSAVSQHLRASQANCVLSATKEWLQALGAALRCLETR